MTSRVQGGDAVGGTPWSLRKNELATYGADYDESYYDDCCSESAVVATTMLRPCTPSSRLKSRLMIYDDATTMMTTMIATTMMAPRSRLKSRLVKTCKARCATCARCAICDKMALRCCRMRHRVTEGHRAPCARACAHLLLVLVVPVTSTPVLC